jgi:hypothetical protein
MYLSPAAYPDFLAISFLALDFCCVGLLLQGARKTSRLSMMPSAATAANGSNSGPAGGSLGIYEDTELINPMSSTAQNPSFADQGPAFGVYEDTEFVGAKLAYAAAARGSSSRSGSDGPGGSNSFGLYEDTDFITRPVGNAGGSGGRASMAGAVGGLGLYEDTDFITRHVGSATGSGGSRSGGRQSMAAPGAGFGLYEDTEFITRPVGDSDVSMVGPAAAVGSSAGGGGSNGLSVYEDTEFITRPVGSAATAAAGPSSQGEAAGGLGLYEDTEFITKRTVPPAAAGTIGSGSGSSTMLLSKLERLSLANEALLKGQGGQRPGLRGSRDDENAGSAVWRWTVQGPAWQRLHCGTVAPAIAKRPSWHRQCVLCLLLRRLWLAAQNLEHHPAPS